MVCSNVRNINDINSINMIKNLVFDLGGVLMGLNKEACIKAFIDNVGLHGFGNLLGLYKQEGFFADFENGKIGAVDFYRTIKEMAKEEGNNDKYLSVSDDQIDFSLNELLEGVQSETIDILLDLKREYNLYLLSNTNEIAWKKIDHTFRESGHPIETLFIKLYRSYRLGISKPCVEVFYKIIEDSGIDPAESIFVDDGPANVEAAEMAGFSTILFKPGDSLREVLRNKINEIK